jgi:hypothetical protein
VLQPAITIIAILLLASPVPATVPRDGSVSGAGLAAHARTGAKKLERAAILQVIEHRTSEPRVVERLQEKLAKLDDRRLQLVAALCERIAADGGGPGAEIAYTMIMVLIVLS